MYTQDRNLWGERAEQMRRKERDATETFPSALESTYATDSPTHAPSGPDSLPSTQQGRAAARLKRQRRRRLAVWAVSVGMISLGAVAAGLLAMH